MEHKNCWKDMSAKELKMLEKICADYRDFISDAKTERECVDRIVNTIENNGYVELEKVIADGRSLSVGDRVYSVWMNKALCMFQIGEKPMTDGMNILGAHIDSPRMDLKQNPLFEKDGFAYFDTHYYGGIKKYQWATIPLALHGVIVKKDGTTVEVNVGENDDDPVFFISDLLIHLASDQMGKRASEVIEGEALDIIIGNKPIFIDKTSAKKSKSDKAVLKKSSDKKKSEEAKDSKEAKDAKEGVKAGVLDILKNMYDVEEEDFLSAEIEVVPAGKAREAGFDRSMILGYGQDDRVCAFTSMQAMLDLPKTDRTVCCILVDKEEIGSVGATGMRSKFFENTVAELMNVQGNYNELNMRRCLSRSCMLSSDVSAGYDPSYAGSFERNNSAFLGQGIVLNKFTGARGKSGSNDANAEYIAHIRSIFEKEKVNFQTAELGKVDAGGGGTIAYILALLGMNVIDSGVAVLNMHAPWEATSKADVYEAYKGYVAFCKNASL